MGYLGQLILMVILFVAPQRHSVGALTAGAVKG
jgi:ABC-type maltose transport system permease subunit